MNREYKTAKDYFDYWKDKLHLADHPQKVFNEAIELYEKAIEKQENETRYLKIKYDGSLIKHTLNIQRNNKLQEELREQQKERRLLQAKNSDLLVRIDNMGDRLKSLLYNRDNS